MRGAILGDIVGSRFEFDRGEKTRDFTFLTPECKWTDDTVMTVAIADALLRTRDEDIQTIKSACIESMRVWGNRYPHAGYGSRFRVWLGARYPQPYGSFGNGSAMRVSPVGWLHDSIDRTRSVAAATAEVTHNHPEGIKGAECTVAVIFLARYGESKEAIKKYVVDEFGYDIRTLDEIRPMHRHDESCMDALPAALSAFFEGDSYEDVVRNAVSLGGDTDTIAAIAGSMAEGYFGMTTELKEKCVSYVTEPMKEVVSRFDKVKNCRLDGIMYK